MKNIVTYINDYKQSLDLVNRFTDYLQGVATNNYNNIAGFYTTNHSTLSLLSTSTSLHNGYSSAVFSLDVSW
jgi:hypothetical protein